MTKLSLIYLISFFLIAVLIGKPPISATKSAGRHLFKLEHIFDHRENANLAKAYLFGDKTGLSRKIKRAYKDLNLYHLFTPSGLHFSSLLFILTPFLWLIKKRSKLAVFIILIPFLVGPQFLEGFYSIKRIGLYRLLKETVSLFSRNYNPFYLFIATFTFDFVFGTFSKSPMSFSFSFLFLGIIFSLIEKPGISWPFALFGGQLIIAWHFGQAVLFTGFIFGFILTSLFTLFFPILLINYLLPWANFSEIFLELFSKAVIFSSQMVQNFGHLHPTIPILLAVFFLSLRKRNFLIAGFLLLISSSPVFNSPRYAYQHSRFSKFDSFHEISKIKKAAHEGRLKILKIR